MSSAALHRVPGAACLLLAGLASACRSSEPTSRATEPSPEEEAKQLVADARRELEREAPQTAEAPQRLYVPPPNATGGRWPLLVFLHGLGGSGAGLVESLRLREMADALGFAFMAPDGPMDYSGRRFWNAGPSCCNFDRLEVDHVAALGQWIGEALREPGVDPKRVYLVGFSNGGFMAYRAACELAPLLRGIFSIAGAGPSDATKCQPAAKLSVVQIHGDRDPIVKFEGGHLFADKRRPRHPSAEQSVAWWAKLDACSSTSEEGRVLDLDPRIPGGETLVSSFPGCAEGRVELWRIRGGDHAAGLSRYSVNAIMNFIRDAGPGHAPAP